MHSQSFVCTNSFISFPLHVQLVPLVHVVRKLWQTHVYQNEAEVGAQANDEVPVTLTLVDTADENS